MSEVKDKLITAENLKNAYDDNKRAISSLKSDLAEQNVYDIKLTHNLLNPAEVEKNTKIIGDGTTMADNNWNITGFIDVSGYTSLHLLESSSGEIGVSWYLYDESYTFISNIQSNVVSIPTNAKYVRCQAWQASFDFSSGNYSICDVNFVIFERYEYKKIIKSGIVIPESTSFFEYDNTNIYDGLCIFGKRLNSDGKTYLGSGDNITSGYIEVIGDRKLFVSKDGEQKNFSAIASYDENFEMVDGSYAQYVNSYDIPKNAKYIRFSTVAKDKIQVQYDKITEYVEHNTPYVPQKYMDKSKPYYGEKILCLGDSTTHIGGWVEQYKTIMKPSVCVKLALSQATLVDKSTTVYDTTLTPSSDTGIIDFTASGGTDNNTLSNQIERLKLAINTNDERVADFDRIFVLITFNDWYSDDVLDFEKYFTDSNGFIDYTTIDRTKFGGAMRFCVESLMTLYPNAKIHLLCPFQSATTAGVNSSFVQSNGKAKFICKIAERMGLNAIRTDKCGIYGAFETNGNGKYLSDGLHQNEKGSKLIANYVATEVASEFVLLI